MKIPRRIFVILPFIFSLLYTGCSSSSYSQRYSGERDKEQVPAKKERFASYSNPSSASEDDLSGAPFKEDENYKRKFLMRYGEAGVSSVKLTMRERLLMEIVKFLNTPYAYGGEGKNGIDCSAFTRSVYQKSMGIELPRTASQQYNTGVPISKKDLKFGDLVFFNTSRTRFPGHVGIYLGEGLFAHSSVSRGVTVSSLNSNYYKRIFVGARRIAPLEKRLR